MKPDSWKRLHAQLARCCEALFRANALEVVEAGPVEHVGPYAQSIVSVIGFSGEQLSGSLALLLPPSVVERSHPLRETGPLDAAARHDWAGEVGNQLLGRLKNRLLSYGIVLQMATPMTFSGREVFGAGERHEGFVCLRFRAGDDAFDVVFDGAAQVDIALDADKEQPGADVEESTILMF
ncbi:MAG: chemotaxis protein CheX [Deltaproteobacteria bacterium]|nr:chemotaxis protein CheX [Deltaproteobacteria bacterium]